MLKLVLGRAHTGKSGKLLTDICAGAAMREQLLLVPEQHSHNSERSLAALGGSGVSLRAEVLSFTRLCDRVFAEAGGLAAATLDEGGRLLLLHRAMQECSDQLQVLRRTKIGFLETLLKTIDECKAFQVEPLQLYQSGGEETETGRKLRDLALLLDTYNALLTQTALDPRDKLTQLAQRLTQTQWCKGKDIYIDGFTDFTKQEREVIRQLLRQARSVTVALTCDALTENPDGIDVFAPARRTALQLISLAQQVGAEQQVLVLSERKEPLHPAVAHVEKYLFSVEEPAYKGMNTTALRVAKTPLSELEWVAAEILHLVREEGYRYRDIAVVGRSMEPYDCIAELVFARYGIPLFYAAKRPLLEQPVMVLVVGALEAVVGGYRYEALFQYLKTGLTGHRRDHLDRLENYVLTWNLRGSAWTAKKPWDKHPAGFGAQWQDGDAEEVAALDELRRQIIGPLELLRKSGATDIEGHARAFYNFLEAIRLPARLSEQTQQLLAASELTAAEESRQIWAALCRGLDQCVAIAGGCGATLEEFAQLITLVLSQYEIGTIPVSLDRVTMQEYSRLGAKRPRALFFIGADDGAVPQVSPAAGILSEEDRRVLAQAGIEVSPSSDLRLLREMTMLYETCTAPLERLVVSYVQRGEQSAPSLVWNRIKQLFPQAPVTSEEIEGEEFRLAAPVPALEVAARHPAAAQALEQLPEFAPRLLRMRRAAVLSRGRLSPEALERLYGGRVRMSASRLDKLKSCHFSDFMHYGLRAKERRRARFDAPVYGTFVHFVLEQVLQGIEGRGHVAPQELDELIDRAIEAFSRQTFGDLSDYNGRFRHLFLRQRERVRAVARDVVEELSRSAFTPRGHELSFGAGRAVPAPEVRGGGLSLELSGFVDRVDGYEYGGNLFLRVMDYKTGTKKIDWTAMGEGMGLQMLLYLYALEQNGSGYFGAPVAPAGVLYVPASDPVVDGNFTMTEAERLKARSKAIRRSGLVLAEPEILTAMETPPEGEEPVFLPADQLSPEEFNLLRGHVVTTLQQTAQEMAEGKICADPYYRNEQDNGCHYCEYYRACHFEEGSGTDRRRYLRSMKKDEFWSSIKDKEVVQRG